MVFVWICDFPRNSASLFCVSFYFPEIKIFCVFLGLVEIRGSHRVVYESGFWDVSR